MKHLFILILMALSSCSLWAAQVPFEGFKYGNATKPDGDEWNNPAKLAYNKEMPHAWFFPFESVEKARLVLPENSEYYQSLNGKWSFHWAPDPEHRPADFYQQGFSAQGWDEVTVPMSWNIYGIQKNGELKYGVPIYVNQQVIFKHRVAVDDWRGGVMRTPPTDWTTYKYRNEVGSYLRKFQIPSSWDGKDIFISFDGVDPFFYLWINGHYVGFSKNSRNAARFNITRFIQKGENTIAVEVYRNSDASFLEAQDMFRLPGIFRTVALYATPKLRIRDLRVVPDLDAQMANGSLKVEADVVNLSSKAAKNYHIDYSLFANQLYSAQNSPVENIIGKSDNLQLAVGTEATAQTTIFVVKPNLWSAETPNCYTLVAQLKDKKNKVIETVSTLVGFRKVEIKDTPAAEDEFGLAGRYYYINGKPVKLKGVNRHESSPSEGHAITHKQMFEEVMMMKRANINHVRNSHYPDDPYWYYLCNLYGIYLEDEANIESHEYYYGEASLSHPEEWRPAHVARVMEMVHSNINQPSIVIWSLGNEAGPGHNFKAAYDSLKLFDLSRPVQYERNNDIVDMGSNQYPSIDWVREMVKGKAKIKYPFHISEYAHSMGNAVGNLIDYWKAIESTNFFCGGAIWDWIDQAMYYYDKNTGERYMAYGGDFGDKPNDGQFVMNGIIFANLEPKPQYYEVKKVYQNIQIDAVDMKQGKISVFNKQYFNNLSAYNVKCLLYRDGKMVQTASLDLGNVGPRQKATYQIPFNLSNLDSKSEYFVKIQFLQKNNTPWAEAGYVQAEEQLKLKDAEPASALLAQNEAQSGNLELASLSDSIVRIKGNNFDVRFNQNSGTIYSLTYGSQVIIPEGCGPTIDAFRAFTNNDNWFYNSWFENGLYNLRNHVESSKVMKNKDGSVTLLFSLYAQAPYGATLGGNGAASGRFVVNEHKERPFGVNDFRFIANQLWTVFPDGSIELQSSISSNRPSFTLPRLGYVMELPKSLGKLSYYGRGPIGNYPDRKTGQNIERYETSVAKEINIWPKPQDTGNHEEVRWCALTDEAGNGAAFITSKPMSMQALPNSALQMTLAPHTYQLPKEPNNYLHLDIAVTGLGGNSCGQGGPLNHDRVKASDHLFGFLIRPVRGDIDKQVSVRLSETTPLMITRSADGQVSIKGATANEKVYYRLNNGKQQVYNDAFLMENAGKVTAWTAKRPELLYSMNFEKLEATPTTVVYVSSEETSGDEGLASHLTDNNPMTYWHTMYSVTVAKYPHWVDFDAGKVKNIKGFTFLPRQDSRNGLIKDYQIQVSIDGKNWGEPVVSGSFPKDLKERRMMLDKPLKARYVRFKALNSHNGQDFATGAVFTVLTE